MPYFHIPDVFSQIVSSYEIADPAKMKPDSYMLDVIIKKQGVSPSDTVFVGDARTDVQMAYNAGVTPIVVLTGHLNYQEAKDLNVKYIIDDVTGIEQVLNEINATK